MQTGNGCANSVQSESHIKKTWTDRYSEALKTLIPFRFGKRTRDKNSLPNSNLGLLNFVSLQWMDKMMWNASRNGMNREDVKQMNRADRVEANGKRISRLWTEEVKSRGIENASLSRALWKFSRLRIIMSNLLMALTCFFQFASPAWGLKYLLEYVGDDSQPLWQGIIWIIALSVSQFLRGFFNSAMCVLSTYTGVRAQAALQMLIYEKVLKIRFHNDKLSAEVFNYFTNDMERIDLMMQLSMFMIGVPVMCTLNIFYCYFTMGAWSLLGNVIVVTYYPIMILVGKWTGKFRLTSINLTDKRISLMSQILNSIKLIKMYAWESKFSERINDIRKKEEKQLFQADLLQSMSLTFPFVVLIIAPMVSIIGHVLSGQNLTAPVAISITTVFPILQLALNTLPMAVKSMSEGLVCCQRLQKMLLMDDFQLPDKMGVTKCDYAVDIRNAVLAWAGTKHDDADAADTSSKTNPRKMSIQEVMSTDQDITNTDQDFFCMGQRGSYTRRPSLNPSATGCSVTGLEVGISNAAFEAIVETKDGETAKADSEPLTVTMKDINIQLQKGQLIGICGNVGSGKSTLLAGISGEAIIASGSVNVRGSVAMATQKAWIFNATLRENILFGQPFIKEKYNEVVEACCLSTDFNILPNRDQTEIGEKGANLSGGQKQRVNLARAVYSDGDVYLLDDTLSAVDVNVGKHIFQNCIKKVLHGKTVLLVTHAVHVLEQCDHILLMKDGEIKEQGTHQQLLALKGDYNQMYQCDQEQRNENKTNNNAVKVSSVERRIESDDDFIGDNEIIKEEVDKSNKITLKSLLYFVRACGGYVVMSLAFFTLVLFALAAIFSSVWLQVWLDAGSGQRVHPETDTRQYNLRLNPDLLTYVTVYGASGVALILCAILKCVTFIKVMLVGAKGMHKKLFDKVLRSPISFFDTTPLGRILGRFSRDMDEMDVVVPYLSDFILQCFVLITFRLILIGVLYNIFLIAIAIISVLFILMSIYLIKAVRESKRVENLLRPPVLVHVSTTIQGLAVIRTFKKEPIFIDKFVELVDKHLSSYLVYQLSIKWVSFRIDILCWLTITVICITIVFTKGQVSPAIAGLALSYMLQICCILAVVARFQSELEAKLISIERIATYCMTLKEEAPATEPEKRPPTKWPMNGNIKFDRVQMKYRPNTPVVLHDLTVDIRGGEKVGVIGRTGAGKSSIVECLLRITEICGGSITIDGVDISKIGLADLRSNIAVIPQEPVIFQGTVRWNLDPFGIRKDEEIWDALEKTHLKTAVGQTLRKPFNKDIAKEPCQLDTILSSDGGSFSVGEKQLLCLARALLKRNKILLLDEATASLDVETDTLIQETIRKSFKECTVITIAHRLNTIADCEKILSLDAGRVIEYDSPENLLNRDSIFRSMMKSMAETNKIT